jgi:hypothetical protein
MNFRPFLFAGLIFAAAAPAFTAQNEGRTARFQFEAFGFGSTYRENSLNNAVGAMSDRQESFYNTYLAYLYNVGTLTSWEENVEGAWKGLVTAWPFGARIKVHVSENILLSLGLERIVAGASTEITGSYKRTFADGAIDALDFGYQPYSLEASAWAPLLGFHVYTPPKDNWSAEGGLYAGLLFGKLVFDSTWYEEGNPSLFDPDSPRLDPTHVTRGSLRMEGTGLGFCVELEGRLSYFLFRNAGLFAGVMIGFREVPTLSGPGREVRDGATTEWNGEWSLKKETIERPWNTLTLEYPSNNWTAGAAGVRSGDFHLDLSGIWIGGGLFIRF